MEHRSIYTALLKIAARIRPSQTAFNSLEIPHLIDPTCLDAIWHLLSLCWALKPGQRPSASEITVHMNTITGAILPPSNERSTSLMTF